MSLLFRIIYAAHANGTHHKLALDALQKLRHPEAEAWRNVVLEHVVLYLEGSKDPDNKFKDFKNHVLHVSDNYWGGAPEKVESWYGHTVTALREGRWSEAVYAAGVLSHYYTDPIQPFHTGQTEAENNIHRAAEWSINRSYAALKAIGDAKFSSLVVEKPTGPHWLKDMTCRGADFSHRYYEKLIAHYDIHRGVVDPPAGLDGIAQNLVAELITYASTGLALILDRAFTEAAVAPPAVNLTADTVVAALKIPLKFVQKKLTNAADRDLVQAMYDELQATGTVEANLPEDDRTVRNLHAREVLAPKAVAKAKARAKRLPQTDPIKVPATRGPRIKSVIAPPASAAGAVPPAATTAAPPIAAMSSVPTIAPMAAMAPVVPIARAVIEPIAPKLAVVEPRPRPEPLPAQVVAPAHVLVAAPVTSATTSVPIIPRTPIVAIETEAPPVAPELRETTAPPHGPRFYLTESDNLEAAPSIGPKMAERFAAFGIVTVGQFLAADAGDLSARLALRLLTPDVLEDWQHQARLVMSVPGLRGTHAQLLVGAGYRDHASLAVADAGELSAAVLNYAITTEGQRILRDGNPPDLEKIKAWIENANAAKAA